MTSLAILTVVSLMVIVSIPPSEGSTDQETVLLNIGADESLTLTEDTILSEGRNIVRGELNVPEGVTLTVQSGSELILDGETCEMTVDGTLIVIEGEARLTSHHSNWIIQGSYLY